MAIHNKHSGFTDKDKERLRDMYCHKEMTVSEIAKIEKCSLKRLREAFKTFNIQPRDHKTKTQRYKNAMNAFWTEEQRDEIRKNNPTKQHSREKCIRDFIEVHGEKYNYSKVRYHGCFENVTIICPIHGEFRQRPSNHKSGSGCPSCGTSRLIGGYNEIHFKRNPNAKRSPAVFYIVLFYNEEENFIKCGITTNTVTYRISGKTKQHYQYKILKQENGTLYEMYQKEQSFIQNNKQNSYQPKHKFDGWTECFDANTKY